MPLTGTAYQQVLRRQQVDVRAHDDGARLIAPVTNRGDPIGVLELVLPSYPDRQVVSDVASAAHALAYVVIAARRYTDLFEWGQRTTPPSLAAEVQRRLLPDSFTCEAGQFSLAGWLEPSSTVGGDTFDYAVDRDTLHLSVTDAVGHTAQSALLATLLVTDGMLERNAARLDLFAALMDTADLHPREVVHELSHAVLAAIGGQLRDDAAVLCLDWYGGSARRRHATGGAGELQASP